MMWEIRQANKHSGKRSGFVLGLVVWPTGPELHIWAGREPPNESPLPGTHHFGQANQSGGLLDAREGSSQIIQVSKVLHSRGPSAGIVPWEQPSKPGSYLHLPHLSATGQFTKHLHTSILFLPPNNPMRMSEESCSFYTANCADEASTL